MIIFKEFVQKYNLPSNKVEASHLSDLYQANKQLDYSLILTPKMKSNMIERKGYFNKMKEGNTTDVISQAVGSAMTFYDLVINHQSYITTVWFISLMAKWFNYMSTRTLHLALTNHNPQNLKEAIDFLEEVMELIQKLQVGDKHIWKPWQTGILITTKSVIELSRYLLEFQNFSFILTSRFSQDCLENVFYVLRSKHVVPDVLQLKNDLKLLSVAQYMKKVSNSRYEEDDRGFLSEFLDDLAEKYKNKNKQKNEFLTN